ncbi:MAG TPA: hypothetical protein VJ824_11200 [Bacillota bacterium]|nr:hypothetical protein [Bacillota bacterium]
MSKTKALVGGKTLSLWIPDEEWVDDFNHLLSKRAKSDRSLTRNSLFLQCVEVGLAHLDDKQESDSIRIHLDTFPPEQAELLRTSAGKQLVTNLISAMLAGQLAPSSIPVQATAQQLTDIHQVRDTKEVFSIPTPISDPDPIPIPVAVAQKEMAATEPKIPEKKIPDLFHTLMRNSSLT